MSMMLASQVWHLDLDKTTAFVLMAICDVADDDGTGCIGSDEYIMWKTGISRATFFRTLSRLEKLNVIKRVPLADGRIETLVAIARAPRKTPWREVRAQLRQSQNETSKPASLKMRLGESQNETESAKMKVPSEQAASGAAARTPTNVIHPSDPSSLLRPPTAAREGATAKQSKADPERQALTAALAKYPQYFGQPRSANEWKLWNSRLTSLVAGGLRPGDVPRAVSAWKRKYPGAQLTINALDNHLGELLPPPPPTLTLAPDDELTNDVTPPTTQENTPDAHDRIDPAALDSADAPNPSTPTPGPTPGPTTGLTLEDLRARADAARLAARAKVHAALAQANRAAAEVAPRRGGLALAARPSRQVPQL